MGQSDRLLVSMNTAEILHRLPLEIWRPLFGNYGRMACGVAIRAEKLDKFSSRDLTLDGVNRQARQMALFNFKRLGMVDFNNVYDPEVALTKSTLWGVFEALIAAATDEPLKQIRNGEACQLPIDRLGAELTGSPTRTKLGCYIAYHAPEDPFSVRDVFRELCMAGKNSTPHSTALTQAGLLLPHSSSSADLVVMSDSPYWDVYRAINNALPAGRLPGPA